MDGDSVGYANTRKSRVVLAITAMAIVVVVGGVCCLGGMWFGHGDDAVEDVRGDDCEAVELLRRMDDTFSMTSEQRDAVFAGACLAWDRRFPNPDSPRERLHGTRLECSDESTVALATASTTFTSWFYGFNSETARQGQPSYEQAVQLVAEALAGNRELVGLRGARADEIERWLRETPGFVAQAWLTGNNSSISREDEARRDEWLATARASSCPDAPAGPVHTASDVEGCALHGIVTARSMAT